MSMAQGGSTPRERAERARARAAELAQLQADFAAGERLDGDDLARSREALAEAQTYGRIAHERAAEAHRHAADAHRRAADVAEAIGDQGRAAVHRQQAEDDDRAATADDDRAGKSH